MECSNKGTCDRKKKEHVNVSTVMMVLPVNVPPVQVILIHVLGMASVRISNNWLLPITVISMNYGIVILPWVVNVMLVTMVLTAQLVNVKLVSIHYTMTTLLQSNILNSTLPR